MNVGRKIIEIRKERNMTQEDFAKVFHVTRQTVSNWENEKSYPDLQTLVKISDEFGISLDLILKEDMRMVKKIDHYRYYKTIVVGVITCILALGILAGIYTGVCYAQHKHMYDKVEEAGFKKEQTEEFIKKYQGFYGLTENGVDYLVEPKYVGKYELDHENFMLAARKGEKDITLIIDQNGKILLSLYPGDVEIDENGNIMDTSQKLTDTQKEKINELLVTRKEEILPIIKRAVELWNFING